MDRPMVGGFLGLTGLLGPRVVVGACGASFDKTAVHEQKSYSALSRRATVSMCMVWGNMSTGWTSLRV